MVKTNCVSSFLRMHFSQHFLRYVQPAITASSFYSSTLLISYLCQDMGSLIRLFSFRSDLHQEFVSRA